MERSAEIKQDIKTVVAENVQHYRKLKGYSQEYLAELCDMCRTYIGSIEQRKANISIKNLDRIAHALEVDTEQLVSRSDHARKQCEWGQISVRKTPAVVAPDNFAPGDYALCHWDNDQLIMTPLMIENKELNDFLLSWLLMQGETENLQIKVHKILEAIKQVEL